MTDSQEPTEPDFLFALDARSPEEVAAFHAWARKHNELGDALDRAYRRIKELEGARPQEGKVLVPGGEDLTVCHHCVGHAVAAGKWEARFATMLVAHERALRLIEERDDR